MLEKKVSVVVVTFNAIDYVKKCISSIIEYTNPVHEIIIVDNHSDKPTIDYLKSLEERQNFKLIFNPENKLWSPGNNIGIRHASNDSEFVLLLNSDTEVLSDKWISKLQQPFQDKRIGISGIQYNFHHYGPLFGAIDGCCFMVKRELINKIGLLDEAYPWNGAGYIFTAKAWANGFYYQHVTDKDVLVHYGKRSRITNQAMLENQRVNIPEILTDYGLEPKKDLLKLLFYKAGMFHINNHIKSKYLDKK